MMNRNFDFGMLPLLIALEAEVGYAILLCAITNFLLIAEPFVTISYWFNIQYLIILNT